MFAPCSPEWKPVEDLRIAGIHVLQSTKLLFGDLYHYLQNPLVLVSPLHLGPASVMELKASEHKNVVGKRVGSLRRRRSRLVGLIRGGKLVFPAPEAKIRRGRPAGSHGGPRRLPVRLRHAGVR